MAKQNQLTKLLLTHESLNILQEESKLYHRTLLATFATSLLLLYPVNKYAPLGKGFSAVVGKAFLSVGLIAGMLYYSNKTCKDKFSVLKKKIYT